MFLQHPHHSLQLSQSEALRQSASGPKGRSGPLHQVCTLQRVRLQARLPQPGPERAASPTLYTNNGQEEHIHTWPHISPRCTFCMLCGHSSDKHCTPLLLHSCLLQSRSIYCCPFSTELVCSQVPVQQKPCWQPV